MNRPYLRDLRKPPWRATGAVVALASGLVAVGDSPARGLTQATVLRGDVTATASAAGSVGSADTRELVFGASGTVKTIEVSPGDKVRSGTVLARLDDSEARDQVEVAKAALAAAHDTYAKAQEGICTGGGASGGSGARPGGSGTGSGGSVEVAGYRPGAVRRPAPSSSRTPTPTPSPTRTTPAPPHQPAPTPTPGPTRTTPKPTPTASRPTRRPSGRPEPTGRPGRGRGAGGGRSGSGGGPGGNACEANAVELASAGVTEAEVRKRQAERALDATKITAPMDGTVLSVSGAVGAKVTGQGRTPFVTLGDLNDLQVRAMFPLGEVDRLRLGRPATIGLGMLAGHSYRGTVTRIDPAATTDGSRALFGVMISFDDRPPAGLRTGMSATVEVTTDEAEDTLYVPASAVHTDQKSGSATVLVRRDGRTVVRRVRTGVRGDRYVAISAGLTAGDHVLMPEDTGTDGFPAATFPGT